jgi:putative transposase
MQLSATARDSLRVRATGSASAFLGFRETRSRYNGSPPSLHFSVRRKSALALTLTGWKRLYLLAFLHVGTRRVFLSPATAHPDEAWVRRQAVAFIDDAKAKGLKAGILFHDRDSKFTEAFNADLKTAGIEVHLSPPRAPNTNAFVERFVGSIKGECLNHFIILGEKHLNYLASSWMDHYHNQRPHQGRDRNNEPLVGFKPSGAIEGKVCCKKSLGGLLKHYYRQAA